MNWGLLNDKIIFSGRTDALGFELYISDGTPGGTVLLSDIYPGQLVPAQLILHY